MIRICLVIAFASFCVNCSALAQTYDDGSFASGEEFIQVSNGAGWYCTAWRKTNTTKGGALVGHGHSLNRAVAQAKAIEDCEFRSGYSCVGGGCSRE